MDETPTRQLTLFLVKSDVAEPGDVVRADARTEAHPMRSGFPLEGTLFVEGQRRRPPNWLQFVNDGLDEPLQQWNQSTAALLVFRADNRLFACTFGYGRSLLDFTKVVDGFGLRVTVNAVNPDRLRSVDLRVLDELAVTRRVQASRSATQETFGIDPARDLLRAVTGEPADPTVARRLTGADALGLYADIELGDLGVKAAQLMGFYGARTYRARFPWIDNVAPIGDLSRRDDLDDRMLEAVKNPKGQVLYLAPPEIVDWSGLTFRYYREGVSATEGHHDLDLEAYLERINMDELDIHALHGHRIRGYVGDEAGARYEWQVYRCLVFETTHRGQTCLLIEGNWYAVDRTFAKKVSSALKALDRSTLPFPPNQANQYEAPYNKIAAKVLGAGLMDNKLVRVALAKDPIELCDLFTSGRELAHVKRRTSSSTLSHLFAQGRIATEALFSDDELRERARRHLVKRPDLAGLIPPTRPNGADFTVVYAVITPNPTDFPENLPFFSRLNMVQSARELRNTLGVKVAIAGIEQL